MAHKPNIGTLRLHSELRTLSLTNKEVQESLSDKTFCRRSLQKSTKRVTSSFYHFGRSQMSADPWRRHCKRDMSYRADPRFQGQMSGARGSICGRILGDERVDDLHAYEPLKIRKSSSRGHHLRHTDFLRMCW